MKNIKLGKYLHYKNKFYEVISEARHSETLEDFVVYYSLTKKLTRKKLWIRPKKMFLEKVEIGGKKVPRFRFVGNNH
jgi:cyclomaltodextrinase / maltogenic alpha-amylase / neopullulanase